MYYNEAMDKLYDVFKNVDMAYKPRIYDECEDEDEEEEKSADMKETNVPDIYPRKEFDSYERVDGSPCFVNQNHVLFLEDSDKGNKVIVHFDNGSFITVKGRLKNSDEASAEPIMKPLDKEDKGQKKVKYWKRICHITSDGTSYFHICPECFENAIVDENIREVLSYYCPNCGASLSINVNEEVDF